MDNGNTTVASQQQMVPANKPKKTKIIIGVVIALVLLAGAGTYLKDAIFSGSEITSADLVEGTESGISFKRPTQWKKASAAGEGVDAAYTEDGKSLGESDQGMLLISDDLGVNYNDLSEAQKTSISESFKTQFSKPETLGNGSCEEISSVNTEELNQEGYDTAFKVEANCDKFAGRGVKATIKMLIGIVDNKIQITGILAIQETWEKSGGALDEILTSVKPTS